MEEEPLTKDPAAQPEGYNSTDTQEAPAEETPAPPPAKETPKEEKKKIVDKTDSGDSEKNSEFVPPIILSCITFWLCGFIFGGLAFILAVVGKSKADSGNHEEAGRLKKASIVLSVIGILVGAAVIIAGLVVYFVILKDKPIHG